MYLAQADQRIFTIATAIAAKQSRDCGKRVKCVATNVTPIETALPPIPHRHKRSPIKRMRPLSRRAPPL